MKSLEKKKKEACRTELRRRAVLFSRKNELAATGRCTGVRIELYFFVSQRRKPVRTKKNPINPERGLITLQGTLGE